MKLITKFVLPFSLLFFSFAINAQNTIQEVEDELDKAVRAKNYTHAALQYKKVYYFDPVEERNPSYLKRAAWCYAKALDKQNVLLTLDTAIDAGYTDFYTLRSEQEFDFLREDPGWKRIIRKQQMVYNNKEDTFYWGLYYGLLTILFLLNLFLFFSEKEISYIYFCLLLIADAQWELMVNFSAKVYFVKIIPWMDLLPDLVPRVTFILLLIVFFILFSQSFLKLKHRLPKLNKVITVGLFLLLFIFVIYVFKIRVPEIIFVSILMSTFILCIISGIVIWRRGHKEARFYVLAAIPLIISPFFPLSRVIFVYSIFNIGLLLFYVILTIALGDKMKIMRLDKEKAQEKALEVLEEKVQERTEEVVRQKHLVEEKQKELTDSITYAKRLQEAILPPKEFVNKHVPTNFILYQPKDIVAGDFYWAESIGSKFFIAAADSTGHGVPGAMVSVVCSNALNRSVKEFKETETGKILDRTRELVLETFEKSTSEVKDGMDISLMCIDSKNKKITWSGANNPLWYIQDNELKEIKADKQAIGKTDYPKPFSTHALEYKENSTFYLFTDGLADQFGGPNGKKYKYKQFEELLLSISSKSMQEQSDIINASFEVWKGTLEQVDDVCVIGVRV